jgi:hypothetical protein
MGRVRRYKKLKAVDPAAKRRNFVDDTIHDEPPEVFNARVRKSMQETDNIWNDEDARERMLQREAKRELRLAEEKKEKGGVGKKKVEGRREGESMKNFKQRIREATRVTLHEEIRKMTSTAKKKKARLDERKKKRERKKKPVESGSGFEPSEQEFSARADGYLRYSDRGGSDNFARSDNVVFNERVDAPPILDFVPKKKKVEGDGKSKLLLEKMFGSSSSDRKDKPMDREMENLRDQAREAYKAVKEKRKALAQRKQ